MKIGTWSVLGGVGLMCLVGCSGRHLNVGGEENGGTAGKGGAGDDQGGSGGSDIFSGGSGGSDTFSGGSGGSDTFSGGSGGYSLTGGGGSGGGGGYGVGPGADGAPAESCASLVADGLIYFDSDRADFNRDIYVVHPDSSGLTRLTDDPADDREPSISRDGKTLAFTSTRAGSAQIFLLNVATGDVTQLTHREGGAAQGSISPDGQQVAFHSGFSVFVIGIDGSDERELDRGQDSSTAYSWPQFSADGGTLIFDRRNQITALALDGSSRLDIVQNWTTTIQAPAVSPTGAEIAYQVACDGPMLSVWTSPTGRENLPCRDGRRITPLSDREASQPTWGPSSLLAFESKNSAGTSSRVAVISRELGVVYCMATEGGWDDRNPSWFVPR